MSDDKNHEIFIFLVTLVFRSIAFLGVGMLLGCTMNLLITKNDTNVYGMVMTSFIAGLAWQAANSLERESDV